MALSDCPKCWDTPCTCGHEYRSWSAQRLKEHVDMLKLVLIDKLQAVVEGKETMDGKKIAE